MNSSISHQLQLLKNKDDNNYNLTLTEYDKIFDGLCLDYNSLFVLNTYMLQEAYKEILLLKSQIKDLKEKKENE